MSAAERQFQRRARREARRTLQSAVNTVHTSSTRIMFNRSVICMSHSSRAQELETQLRVSRRELFAFEFGALVALDFALWLPAEQIVPHHQRLLLQL